MVKKRQTEEVIQILKDKGLRVTPQRFSVYANLLSRSDHPTAEQLLQDLNKDFPVTSQATIYSSLQALKEVGLIKEVLLEENASRYEANMQSHHHFFCNHCGVIEDIAWETFQVSGIEKLRQELEPKSHEVIVRGVCDRCSSEF